MAMLAVENVDALREMIGKEIGPSDWLTITQKRIDEFADATEDRQWIHIDPRRAKTESPYGTTISHGFLTLSLISHLLKRALEVRDVRLAVNYGLNRVRFPAPVPVDSRTRGRF